MGLTETEFNEVTPAYFNARLSGLRRLQAAQERAAWERTRWQTAVLLAPHSKKELKPTDLFRFPDEQVYKGYANVFEYMEANKHLWDKLTLDGFKKNEVN